MLDKRLNIQADLRLKFDDTLLRKYMRDNFAFSRVFVSVTGVEDAPSNRHKSIIELRLECTISMGINYPECVWFGNREMVRSNSNKWAYKSRRDDG